MVAGHEWRPPVLLAGLWIQAVQFAESARRIGGFVGVNNESRAANEKLPVGSQDRIGVEELWAGFFGILPELGPVVQADRIDQVPARQVGHVRVRRKPG